MLRKVWRYGLAVISVAAALAFTIWLQEYTDITPLFYGAIVVSAWFGGRGPGLLAVVLVGGVTLSRARQLGKADRP